MSKSGSKSADGVGPTIAVTSGEPAGIGPELCARLASPARDGAGRDGLSPPPRLVVLGDLALLRERAVCAAPVTYREYDPARPPRAGEIEVLHLPLRRPSRCGQCDPANSRYVLDLLNRAADGCSSGEFAAMVTAPVHKGVINDAGIGFSGHTEYLAERTGTPKVVMMLAGGGLRVALVTTHLPLAQVPAAITGAEVESTLRITLADLQCKFGIARPRILVAGLNPHAGEGGYLGREEIEVIAPVLDRLRAEGHDIVGPLPADTLFTARVLEGSDAQVAMYHDQGLAVLKYASFGHGINVTLGLPIIRTSVDHGTAFDLAGTGRADPGSLLLAVDQACAMAARAGRAADRASGSAVQPRAEG